MESFSTIDNTLCFDGIKISDLALQFGTPLYIYSANTLKKNIASFQNSLKNTPNRLFYAVKACSNIAILQYLASFSIGFDIVSGGELFRVLASGASPSNVVFSGVGKTIEELKFAIDSDIFCINVESLPELKALIQLSQPLDKKVAIALRINPNVDAHTHHHISTGLLGNKFGLDFDSASEAFNLLQQAPQLQLTGLAFHIGSQIKSVAPYLEAISKIEPLIAACKEKGFQLTHLDIGGGFGISYTGEPSLPIADFLHPIQQKIANLKLTLHLEPGRSLIGNAGALITKVLYLKETGSKNFAIVDAGMNDYIRPTLYGAKHQFYEDKTLPQKTAKIYDIVGPVCETGDTLGIDIPLKSSEGDYLTINSVGAYGASMASRYNTRPQIAEVFIVNSTPHMIRSREQYDDLIQREVLLPVSSFN